MFRSLPDGLKLGFDVSSEGLNSSQVAGVLVKASCSLLYARLLYPSHRALPNKSLTRNIYLNDPNLVLERLAPHPEVKYIYI